MLAEIFEQPTTLTATLAQYVDARGFRSETVAPVQEWLAKQRHILITASGSSRHAGLLAEILMEDASAFLVDVEYASEYCYRTPLAQAGSSVVVISQSGETADTLAALRKAKSEGHATLAITNVSDSTMAREAGVSMPTAAGRELAIPATKSFTAQLLVVHLLSLLAAEQSGSISPEQLATRLDGLRRLPEEIDGQLEGWRREVERVADQYSAMQSFLFLGRGVHFPIAREGALKLKESAYLHAEGYPAGELKHGPNALVSEGTPLVIVATVDPYDGQSRLRHAKVLQLMRDMRAQGANILAIINRGDDEARRLANAAIDVSPTSESLLPIAEVMPLQLLAYFVAVRNGIDVDRPRNLVKAVVAE